MNIEFKLLFGSFLRLFVYPHVGIAGDCVAILSRKAGVVQCGVLRRSLRLPPGGSSPNAGNNEAPAEQPNQKTLHSNWHLKNPREWTIVRRQMLR
jgi:hypothetical protein